MSKKYRLSTGNNIKALILDLQTIDSRTCPRFTPSFKLVYYLAAIALILASCHPKNSDTGWRELFNGKDLSGWDTYLGHRIGDSVSSMHKEPIGLNNDPDRVFSVVNENREQVILENYRSRSNQIRDRLVEPFHVDPEKDTLQAYDVEQKDSRHYRLSRIERVHLTGQPWQYKNDHRAKITDVFRIADNDQVPVHLHLDVFAYNSLTEEFPLTITYIDPGTESNTFELQCSVNHEFKGIQNFIMSNAQHVDIIYPVELRERVKEEAKKILGKLNAQ